MFVNYKVNAFPLLLLRLNRGKVLLKMLSVTVVYVRTGNGTRLYGTKIERDLGHAFARIARRLPFLWRHAPNLGRGSHHCIRLPAHNAVRNGNALRDLPRTSKMD